MTYSSTFQHRPRRLRREGKKEKRKSSKGRKDKGQKKKGTSKGQEELWTWRSTNATRSGKLSQMRFEHWPRQMSQPSSGRVEGAVARRNHSATLYSKIAKWNLGTKHKGCIKAHKAIYADWYSTRLRNKKKKGRGLQASWTIPNSSRGAQGYKPCKQYRDFTMTHKSDRNNEH